MAEEEVESKQTIEANMGDYKCLTAYYPNGLTPDLILIAGNYIAGFAFSGRRIYLL